MKKCTLLLIKATPSTAQLFVLSGTTVVSGKIKDVSHCECSRQSVLYIIGNSLPDKNISVEIIETVLGGAEKCRFKVTVE